MNAPEVAQETVHRSGRAARIGPVHRWRAVLRSEVRKTLSIKLWWVLLIPIVLLSLFSSQFGGLLSLLLPNVAETSPTRLMVGVAATTNGTAIIAALFGALIASGEFRHRTATHSYLTGARPQVLGAKMIVSAVVGAVYGLVMFLMAALLGGAVLGGQQLPGFGDLVSLGLLGMLQCALWGVIGVALGTVVRSQVGVLSLVIGYLAIGEDLLAFVLQIGGDSSFADPSWIAKVSSYLPGNAGNLALYDVAVAGVGDAGSVRQSLELLAFVSAPPPGWVALVVLLVWTAAAIVLAGFVGGRRDVT